MIAWNAIKEVIEGFLGKNRSNNYKSAVETMMNAFDAIKVNMSLKIHFLHFHLDYFSKQLSTESDEQGERYHQVALPFEMRYRGKRAPNAVLAEICWWSKALFEEREDRDESEEQSREISEDHIQQSDASDFDDSDDDEESEQQPAKRARN